MVAALQDGDEASEPVCSSTASAMDRGHETWANGTAAMAGRIGDPTRIVPCALALAVAERAVSLHAYKPGAA